jgi:hypothetical protein
MEAEKTRRKAGFFMPEFDGNSTVLDGSEPS